MGTSGAQQAHCWRKPRNSPKALAIIIRFRSSPIMPSPWRHLNFLFKFSPAQLLQWCSAVRCHQRCCSCSLVLPAWRPAASGSCRRANAQGRIKSKGCEQHTSFPVHFRCVWAVVVLQLVASGELLGLVAPWHASTSGRLRVARQSSQRPCWKTCGASHNTQPWRSSA